MNSNAKEAFVPDPSRQELHIVGDKRAIKRGVSNVVSGERNTFLKLTLGA